MSKPGPAAEVAIFIPEDRSILFSRHALTRMNERRVSPNEVMRALSFGKISYTPNKITEGRAFFNMGKQLLIVGFAEDIVCRTIKTVYFGDETKKIPGGMPCSECTPGSRKIICVEDDGNCSSCRRQVVEILPESLYGALIKRLKFYIGGRQWQRQR